MSTKKDAVVIGNKGNKNYEYHSMHKTPNFNYQNVEIEFDKGAYATVRQEKQKQGKENTIFSFRSPYRYNSNLKGSITGLLMIWGAVADKKSLHDKKMLDI